MTWLIDGTLYVGKTQPTRKNLLTDWKPDPDQYPALDDREILEYSGYQLRTGGRHRKAYFRTDHPETPYLSVKYKEVE